MSVIHFLNVLEGDCNIIQHDSGRVTVIDVSNAYNEVDTDAEKQVKASEARKAMFERTQVPTNKIDYKQKKTPDNPIKYLKKIGIDSIFRFIITHPDMDHLDGIQDLFSEFAIYNTWDTDNNKQIDLTSSFGGYNKEDWEFYKKLRSGKVTSTSRKTYFAKDDNLYYNQDYIKVLCPTPALLKKANECGDYNDSSYVILYTPPKENGTTWKFLFAGDSDDNSWEYILANHAKDVTDVDVLFAPHHGRHSNRSFDFLKTVNPKVTLFGNADSCYLAYDNYPPTRITNNQAGYIIMDIGPKSINFYVKNQEFAVNFSNKREWAAPTYSSEFQAYKIGFLPAT